MTRPTPGPKIRPGGRGITFLVLDYVAIQNLFEPGGDVFQWGRRIGLQVEEAAKAKLVPGRGYRTGDLERSVGHAVTFAYGAVNIHVNATAGHAIWYILGTAPHKIRARNKKALSFFWERENTWFIGKSVNHPGFGGDNFLDEAKEEVLAAHGHLF